ncbi:MAG: tetratricopeptide repeat protein [Verrucomicrobiales bacterium]|nr:tetratricopeptide repeat protein [Verrucomicrobiales bacterium]
MTLFSAQSQMTTLSVLDGVIWEAKSPVALFLEPEPAKFLLEGALYPHLRSHDRPNYTVVMTPKDEKGPVAALAEAIDALFVGVGTHDLSTEKAQKWPTIWKSALECGGGLHRILVVDSFNQIKSASISEQKKFWALLAHLASDSAVSVLLVVDREMGRKFSEFPGFCENESQDHPIQLMDAASQLPDLKRFDSARLPIIIRSLSLLTTLVIALMMVYLFPVETGLVESISDIRNGKLANLPRVLPAPQEIEFAGRFDFNTTSGSDFDRIDPAANLLPAMIHPGLKRRDIEEFSETLHDTFPVPQAFSQKEEHYPDAFSSTLSARDLVIRPEVFKDPSVGRKDPAPLPVSVEEFLGVVRELGDYSLGGFGKALEEMTKQIGNRNFQVVSKWVAELMASPENHELELAEVFAEYGDLEGTFAWYQDYAEKTNSPEALFHVGAAQLFGRGTDVNPEAAVKNLERAWQAGSGDAAYLYGVAQLLGIGMSQDNRKAYTTFNSAIEMGSQLPMREAARMQELGLGAKQNLYWACHLYEKGIEAGDLYCMTRLADIHETGEHGLLPIDPEKAEQLREMAKNVKGDPILHWVKELVPPGFYTQEVVRLK